MPKILAFDREYGLLKPLPVQYLVWATKLLHGNFGFSYRMDDSVSFLIAQSVPRTIALAGTATFLAFLIAVPLGLWEAVRRNHVDDYILTGASFLFYAMPTFFLGMILIILFSIMLPWLPSLGPDPALPLWTQIPNLVLPVATLCLVTIALFSRYMRSATMDVLIQDYVRTARAKGVPSAQVLIRHVLRNALIPIVTLLGLSLPWILSGALIVEALFNYPGMGYLFWQALETDDFPVTLGIVLIVGVMVVLGSLIADILYAVLDPRVRYTSR